MRFFNDEKLEMSQNFLDLYDSYMEWREENKARLDGPTKDLPTLFEFMAWLRQELQRVQDIKDGKFD